VAPNGAAFRREPGILTGILDELFPRREAAKKAGNEVASQAIKILMNSFYGVLGTPACRFHDPDLANAITSFGRDLLLWSRSRIEAAGHHILYGDTDSLFVSSGENDARAAGALGRRLVARINEELRAHVRRRWGVESRLTLEFETLYLKLMLPAVRHGKTGARKRYAGLVEVAGEKRVVFTGLEVVRRDWTDLARTVQRELYERLFANRPVEDYLRGVIRDLRSGRLDALLVYRKALRKGLDTYTATTPPHVAAARKMAGSPGRVISYVMTVAGPEPLQEARSALDYEHYVHKQVRPVAEPVLAFSGLDFDRVIGDDRQMTLF
jgi:DNA polymerase-2